MKQKQVKSSPKPAKQTKNVKTPQKNVPVVAEESDDEETEVVQEKVVAKKAVAKKPVNKKVAKAKQVVVEPEPEEDEEDDDQEEVENAAEEDDEQSDAEMDDDDEQEADDDEQEAVDDDDEDDEAAEEATKEEPTIPSKVKSGPISTHTIPLKKIIHISKLPKHCKTNHIVDVFGKYGKIENINLVNKPLIAYAQVSYATTEAALAAIADSKKVKVLGRTVIIKKATVKKNSTKEDSESDFTVVVKNIKVGTTATELCKHFESCGEIEFFKFVDIPNNTEVQKALITFSNKDSVENAEKLNNSLLNGLNIQVRANKHTEPPVQFIENLTIKLINKQKLKSIDVATLESIFSKCGEIEHIAPICKGNLLAIVMFKTKEAAEKALQLNGKTKKGVELESIPYSKLKENTSISVTNLPIGCTEEDLRKHFDNIGEISNVELKGKRGIIRFEDTDGYCKSFLYNESFFLGQRIFIEPFSPRKHRFLMKLKENTGHTRPFENGHKQPFKKVKRPFENGHTAFRAKKFKQN